MNDNWDSSTADEVTEETETTEDVYLAIKMNEESSSYVCALCGDSRVSSVGPELFLADSWDLICDECGRKYAPTLMALIDLGGAAEGYITTRDAAPPSET